MIGALICAALAVGVLALPGRRVRAVRVPAPPGEAPDKPEVAALLDLLAVAVRSGAALPRALEAVAAAVGPGAGDLAVVGRALAFGLDWDQAWELPEADGASTPARRAALATALEPAWTDGADPEPLLTQAARLDRAGRASAARIAAGRLGVALVLPLGLCLLPAFVLIGLVPVLISEGVGLFGG